MVNQIQKEPSERYQSYPEYKDSGVEWLGEVPINWELTNLKYYSYVKGGYAFPSDSFTINGIPVIRIGDITNEGEVSLDNCKYLPNTKEKEYEQYEIQKNKILMAMTGATIGKAGKYKENIRAYLNQRVGQFELINLKLTYSYLWYILLSESYQEHIKLTASGGAQPNISDHQMVNITIGLPTLQEQTQIAQFLDYETAKIDLLIEKQQKLIELLKEKRQAVISHAVTKGLDPNVEMKDSGVEWLGKIPSHWDLWKLKHAYNNIGSGTTPPTSSEEWFQNGTIPWVTTGELRENIITYTNKYLTNKAYEQFSALRIYPVGSIIIAMYGATIGRLGILGIPATTNQACCVIYHSTKIDNKYLFYWLYAFRNEIINLSSGGGQPNINQEKVSFLKISAPSKTEQIQIAEYLNTQTSKIDLLIEKAEAQIALMQERRTALISAAVTGKMDLRYWQMPEESDYQGGDHE